MAVLVSLTRPPVPSSEPPKKVARLAKRYRYPPMDRISPTFGETAREVQPRGAVVQTKLAIGSTADPSEREADRVANAIMATRASDVMSTIRETPGRPQRKCETCASDDPKVQCKATLNSHTSTAQVQPAPLKLEQKIDHERRHGGRALDTSTNAWMGSRFGADFSRVRVHHGRSSATLASDLSARAFTVGRDIFFGAGEFRPADASGRRLIAHELAHVVQQSRSNDGKPVIRRLTEAEKTAQTSIAISRAIEMLKEARQELFCP